MKILGSNTPGVQRSAREADHSPTACVDVKKTGVYASTAA
jgi:hypothetical protein